jgi:hypothetical protein
MEIEQGIVYHVPPSIWRACSIPYAYLVSLLVLVTRGCRMQRFGVICMCLFTLGHIYSNKYHVKTSLASAYLYLSVKPPQPWNTISSAHRRKSREYHIRERTPTAAPLATSSSSVNTYHTSSSPLNRCTTSRMHAPYIPFAPLTYQRNISCAKMQVIHTPCIGKQFESRNSVQ